MHTRLTRLQQHMNLVISDTEEFRRTKRKVGKTAPGQSAPTVETEERRSIGLTIIRGAQIVSVSVDGPPPSDPSARLGPSAPGGPVPAPVIASGPGVARPAGRGLPPQLTGPAVGVGGPGPTPFGGYPGAPGGFVPPPAFGGGRGGPGGPRMSPSPTITP